MLQLVEGIPGQPHRWAAEIKHWADGGLVQWRYSPAGVPAHLMVKPDRSGWNDCLYANAGAPNWMNPDVEYRVAP